MAETQLVIHQYFRQLLLDYIHLPKSTKVACERRTVNLSADGDLRLYGPRKGGSSVQVLGILAEVYVGNWSVLDHPLCLSI